MAEHDLQPLPTQVRAEFGALMKSVVVALSELEEIDTLMDDPAITPRLKRLLNALRDMYLSASTCRAVSAEQAAVIQQFMTQYQSSKSAYDQGWHDGHIDVCTRLSTIDLALWHRVEQLLSDDSRREEV